MRIQDKKIYIEDMGHVAALDLPWTDLKNRSVLISGATGLIGGFLTDLIMYMDQERDLNCHVITLARNVERLQQRFAPYLENDNLQLLSHDVNEPLDSAALRWKPDYIFHLASNTHPLQYSSDPIGTITANIIGTNNLLALAAELGIQRFVFASSVEVYGENRGDCMQFTEDYCGYINSNTLRAGYPESKRAGEALCQAYIRQKNLDIVIPRLSRTYGPGTLNTDSKAINQFIRKGAVGEDVVLKSEGTQYYSYCYVADAVSGLLYCLFFGECGGAYNIADETSNITLRDLAEMIAQEAGTKVVFEIPDLVERAGYSTATRAALDSTKIKKLNWRSAYSIKEGIKRTIQALHETE